MNTNSADAPPNRTKNEDVNRNLNREQATPGSLSANFWRRGPERLTPGRSAKAVETHTTFDSVELWERFTRDAE